MAYAARIVADSVSEAGDRLTTMEVTFPRMVLAEFNTHRVFSRNSASSRAIPPEKQIDRVRQDPFIPTYWGANQKGMQAESELDAGAIRDAEQAWRAALHNATASAEEMMQLGLHKQLVNRLLEPFMWHTAIVTATEWSNFFALRANPMAQPEIRTIAEMMLELYRTNTPKYVRKGVWHLPLIQPEEYDGVFEFSEDARKISAARCARVSYLTHDGRRDLQADLTLYERLVSGGHMSPLEHVATPNFFTKVQLDASRFFIEKEWDERPWCGNFHGWKQLRKFVRNEQDFSLVEKEGD